MRQKFSAFRDVPPSSPLGPHRYDYILDDIRKSCEIIPPQPPERSGGPQGPRVVVNVEIVDGRSGRRPSATPGLFRAILFWLFALLFVAALAHAQPMRYEHWTAPGRWGEVRQQGTTTDWTTYDRDGRAHTCHRYFVGDQAQTSCR